MPTKCSKRLWPTGGSIRSFALLHPRNTPTRLPLPVSCGVCFRAHVGAYTRGVCVYVCASHTSTKQASQWVRIDFLALNADERLIFMARFMLHFEVSGLVVPVLTVDSYQVTSHESRHHTHVPDPHSADCNTCVCVCVCVCVCLRVCVHTLLWTR